jgi:cbb3-type cytochrome oxidase subunit 3
MTISLVIDAASFWIGFGSSILVAFLGLFVLAAVQYKKQSKGRRKL